MFNDFGGSTLMKTRKHINIFKIFIMLKDNPKARVLSLKFKEKAQKSYGGCSTLVEVSDSGAVEAVMVVGTIRAPIHQEERVSIFRFFTVVVCIPASFPTRTHNIVAFVAVMPSTTALGARALAAAPAAMVMFMTTAMRAVMPSTNAARFAF